MGGWNFITLRIPPLFQSPLLLGDLMGKVKARYTEMEKENNWKEADAYYEEYNTGTLPDKEYDNHNHSVIHEIFNNSNFGVLLFSVLRRLDSAEYKIHKLEKKHEEECKNYKKRS